MPWVKRPNLHATCKAARIPAPIETNDGQNSRDLAGRFGCYAFSSQGIGPRPQPWVERLDFDSGGLAETSFVSATHENRASDVIWKFQRKGDGEPIHVYVHLEFQSRPDASMPVRFMGYESLLYQKLMASEPAAS